MKVRCAVCHYQNKSWCSKKRCKTSLNKARVCNFYELDPAKVKEKHEIPTVYRSEWTHKKKELKKLLKQMAEEEKQKEEMVKQVVVKPPEYLKAPGTGDSKHPLTGDLSRFTSTADRKEDEK